MEKIQKCTFYILNKLIIINKKYVQWYTLRVDYIHSDNMDFLVCLNGMASKYTNKEHYPVIHK